MRHYVNIVKALACDKRLRMLMALRRGKICEGALAELVQISPSAASRHLSVLTNAGLVDFEKRGNCVCYRVVLGGREPLVDETLRWVQNCLRRDPVVIQDADRVIKLTPRGKQRKAKAV